jgi:cytolysin (calcineurin-like family phosphatase)
MFGVASLLVHIPRATRARMTRRWTLLGAWTAVAVGAACGSGAGEGIEPTGDAGAIDATADVTTDDGGMPMSDSAAPSDATTAASDAGNAPSDAAGDAVADSDAAGPSQDVTFFVFGDPQYGGGDTDKDSFNIQALNAAPSLVWPADAGFESAGAPIGDPRGVLIAGDLTQNGQAGRDPLNEWYTGDAYAIDINQAYGANVAVPRVAAELGLFLRDYGLRGNDGLNPFVLKWRVFEGYGNHDFDVLAGDPIVYGGEAPARDVVSIRNKVRATWPEMRQFAPGNAGHYSWDWGNTHFVHLNLVASDAQANNADDDSGAQTPRNPQGALTFLQQDLAAEVGASCRPVILIMHYGFDAFSEEGRWWDEAQRLAFLEVVRPYNVVAILHGHVHETRAYTMSDAFGRGYDVFSLGSPFYTQGTNNGRGHFAVFHLVGNHIDAADISWLPANPSPDMADNKDLWTGKQLADLRFQTTTTFADGWGGWAFSKDIDTTRCGAPDAGTADAAPVDAGSTDAASADAASDAGGSCAYKSGSFAGSCTGCATYASNGLCVIGCESCTKIDGTQNGNPSLVLPCSGDVGNNDGTLVCTP